jgi:hypothetical protein
VIEATGSAWFGKAEQRRKFGWVSGDSHGVYDGRWWKGNIDNYDICSIG